jgi:hypothetical protein
MKFQAIDIPIGSRFGRWTVLACLPERKHHQVQWLCHCDCGTERAVYGHALRYNTSSSCGCYLHDRCGTLHPGWKGGRTTRKTGYVFLTNPEFPGKGINGANESGQVAEHVVVISRHLGRPLYKGETVHHKNGIKNDNQLDNLELWSKSHPAGQRVEDKTRWAIEWLEIYAPEYLNRYPGLER